MGFPGVIEEIGSGFSSCENNSNMEFSWGDKKIMKSAPTRVFVLGFKISDNFEFGWCE